MRRLVLLSILTLVVPACGEAEVPKAPQTAVADAVNGIVAPCGEAHMAIAGNGSAAALRRLDRQALPSARRLAALARRDPHAVYLGTNMADLLRTERSAATGCRLTRTAERLR